MELMQLASAHGCDDLDPEPAVGLLEETGWDVGEAFARLCGEPGGRDRTGLGEARDAAMWSGFPAGLSDLERLQQVHSQQLEWEQRFNTLDMARLAGVTRLLRQAAAPSGTDSPRSPRHGEAGRPWLAAEAGGQGAHARAPDGRGRRSEIPDLDLSSEGDDHSPSEEEEPVPRLPPPAHLAGPRLGVGSRATPSVHSLASLMMGPRMGANRLHRVMLDEYYALADQDEDAPPLAELVHALLRTQDEADFQDAVRLSAEEAYSGGFGVPPAEEALLSSCTRVHTYEGPTEGEGPSQCSVCLGDFEAGDTLRTLQCKHHFHVACVDQWLSQSGQCPVCKRRVGQ